jgi:hypothetical protein
MIDSPLFEGLAMGADCYYCATGYAGRIPGMEAGPAVGTCQICNVLSCLAHGVRDHRHPRWICVACDVGLMAVAAVLKSENRDAQRAALEGISERLVLLAKAIGSVSEYLGNREGEWEWVEREARDYVDMPFPPEAGPLPRLLESMPPDGRLLMASALAMVDRLQIEAGQLLPFLRTIHAWVPDRAR